MRTAFLLSAGFLAAVATPASAQLTTVSINGTMFGTQNTIQCGFGSSAACLQAYPTGLGSQSYAQGFDLSLNPLTLTQGANTFSFGALRSNGLWTGTIFNDNGVLTGSNLSFVYESSGFRFGTVGATNVTASAATFNVVGGIPEPTTWAMLLLGFATIGTALRVQRAKARPALARA